MPPAGAGCWVSRWGIQRGQVGEASAALAEIGIDGGECGSRQIGQDGGSHDEIVDAVIGDAVVAANRRLAGAERIPGEAQRGPEIAQLVLEEFAGHPRHGVAGRAAGDHRLVGDEDVVIRRIGRQADLVTQAEIDGEVGTDLPGILGVHFVFRVARIELEGALGPLVALGDEAAVDLADAAQLEIDVRLEQAAVEGGIEIGGQSRRWRDPRC